jgi:hypothetical protein
VYHLKFEWIIECGFQFVGNRILAK